MRLGTCWLSAIRSGREIRRIRMRQLRFSLVQDVCEADFYFVPHGIATLMRKAYRHSYKRTGQKKMVMEGGINRLLKDLAALSLDKGERHIFNVEEATAKYTINQQNSYRTRYSWKMARPRGKAQRVGGALLWRMDVLMCVLSPCHTELERPGMMTMHVEQRIANIIIDKLENKRGRGCTRVLFFFSYMH